MSNYLLFLMNKSSSIVLALVLLTGALTLPLNISNAQTTNPYFVSFAGDWTCSADAKSNANTLKSKNVELLQGLGDYAYTSNQDCWIDLVQGLNVKLVRGNHEASEQNSAESWDQLVEVFSKTTNPELNNGNFYPYTHKNLYVIALDTQVPLASESQYVFLDAELKKAQQKKAAGEIDYVAIASHKMYLSCAIAPDLSLQDSCGDHMPTEIKDYKKVIQLIYQYADVVDFVFQGHDHNFQLSQPLKFENGKLVVTTAKDPKAVVWGVFGNLGRSLDALPSVSSKPLWQQLIGDEKGAPVVELDPQGKQAKVALYSTSGSQLFNTVVLENGAVEPPPPEAEICGDGIDNNNNGKIDEDCPVDPPPAEICGDGVDNNGNGQIDEDCDPVDVEICGDGIDNNNDGQVDENCPVDPPAEICNNGIDDDGDGKIDEDCPVSPPPVTKAGEINPTKIVATKQDSGKEANKVNDNNYDTRWSAKGDGQKITFTFNATYPITKVGLTGYHYDKTYKFEINGKQFENKAGRTSSTLVEYDLTSLNINSDTVTIIGHGNSGSSYNSYREIQFYTDEQTQPLTEICGNNIDDDKDGLIDEDCPAEICGDGIDNNGDGKVDENCDPPDPEEICGNGIDDDKDGSIDEDCPAEICGDGVDNNGNGQVDENCNPIPTGELAKNVTVNKVNKFTPNYDLAIAGTNFTIYPTEDNTVINILENDTKDTPKPPTQPTVSPTNQTTLKADQIIILGEKLEVQTNQTTVLSNSTNN